MKENIEWWIILAIMMIACLLGQFFPGSVQIAADPRINAGDTAWMLTATALVLLMTPGLALFYGGMVQSRNIISLLAYSPSGVPF